MGTFRHKYLTGVTLLMAGLFFMPHMVSAKDLPDLVITNDSRIPLQGSCKTGEPLWKGIIAIKNIGNAPAKFSSSTAAVLEGIGKTSNGEDSTLVVYVPQNIDLLDKKTLRSELSPLDQKGVEIEIGTNRVKRCRFFNKPPRIRIAHDRYDPGYRTGDNAGRNYYGANANRRVRSLQQALINQGYPLPKYGVDGNYGSETSKALREYYKDRGQRIPAYAYGNTISSSNLDRVLAELGVNELDSAGSGGGEVCTAGARSSDVHVTIYAVVDPYNKIEELNEANNSATFTVNIDCSQGG